MSIHADHLNTPRLIENQSQQVVWRWDQQEPFGVNVLDENPSELGAFEFPLRLPGQYGDKETSLAYNDSRDYYPGVGRYIQFRPFSLRYSMEHSRRLVGPSQWGHTDSDSARSRSDTRIKLRRRTVEAWT